MLDPETKRKARELGVPGFVEALDIIESDPSYTELPFKDKMKVIIDYAYQESQNKLVAHLIKNAHLRFPQADISNIVYENRPLQRELITELGTSQFVSNATDVILEGFTGTGKSHLACAIAKQACKHGLKTLYVRMPDMLAYRDEKIACGWPEKKVLNKYASYKVLVIDEHLIDAPNTDQMHFLLELTERRYDNSSTIYCSQYAVDEWHRRMGGGAYAEAVMDRIVHNAIRIEMGNINMRELMAKKSNN